LTFAGGNATLCFVRRLITMQGIQQRFFIWLPCVLALLSNLAAARAEPAPRFFRSDAGVAVGAGPLPDRLDSPGAMHWRVEIDPGHSTPILWGGKIFLTTYREQANELAAVALDERTGAQLWRQAVTVPKVEQTHAIGSPATATPACDGQRLFVFFGSCGLFCYDLDGKPLWEQRLGPFRDEYGAGSSPIILDGKVILNQDHDIDSFLLAVDGATGKTVWRTPRLDAVRSYATPAVWQRNGHQELLVAGALELAGYEPATGTQLWSLHGLARIVIPTPVPSGDWIYMASWAPGGDAGGRVTLDPWPAALDKWDANHDGKLAKTEIGDPQVLDRFYRMDLDQDGYLNQKEWERHAQFFKRAQNAVLAVKPSGNGELKPSDVVWKYARGVPYVSSPLLDQGRFWMVKDGGIVTKLDAVDGHLLQEERLPGSGRYFSSPVTGDGKVYFASEEGVVSVVANQVEWRVISSHPFHEKIFPTPVIDQDHIYIRTDQALYCFQGAKG
jgi:outer membrane protein assembly factor BamB